MADEFNIPLGFQDNTGPAQDGFQKISAITKLIRQDVEAIVTGTQAISDRAEAMRKFWQDNVELIERMKSVLDIVQTTIQTNQTSLSNNLTQITEILSQVRGLGGNTAQALQMISMAGGGFGGGQFGNVQQYIAGVGQGPLASQNFAAGMDTTDYNLTNPLSYEGLQQINRGTQPGTNGRTFKVKTKGPSYSARTSSTDPNDVRVSSFAKLHLESSAVDKGAPDYLQNQLRDDLSSRFPSIAKQIPEGQEVSAGQFAYNYMNNEVANLLGNSALGRQLNRRFQSYISSAGINMQDIKQSQQDSLYQPKDPESGRLMTTTNQFGQQVPVYTRDTIPQGGVEEQTLKLANVFAQVLNSKFAAGVSNTLGRIGQVSAVYGAAQDIMGGVRQLTGFAQQQGDLYGTTSYARSAGLGLQAWINSGFNLNSKYSTQDYMQAQVMGMGLGLKGAALTQYANNAMQMKANFGMNAQQAQGLTGAALAAGVSQSANLAGVTAERNLASATPNTSTAYTDQAYASGMQTAAALGLSGNAAAQAGVSAAQTSAGNLVAQSMGITGTEGVGTPLMNALMAQQLGTSYTGLGATLGNTSNSKFQNAVNASEEEILGWAGINTKASYKDEKEFRKQNGQQLGVLQLILQGLPDAAHQKAGASYQATYTWAWMIVKKHQTLDTKPKKPGSAIAGIFGGLEHIAHDVGNAAYRATTDAIDAVPGVIGHVAHAAVDLGTDVGGLVSGQSWNTIHNWQRTANNAINNNWSHPGQALLGSMNQAVHQAASLINQGAGWVGSEASRAYKSADAGPIKVEVGFHPNAKGILTAGIKSATAGDKNGQVPPNMQPTRTSFL
jgi:hypothetical protein